ncbi:MAG: type III pantothenate kinase [Bacteroidota bacterium]
MLLAIDIGNTDVVLGVYHQNNWSHLWRFPTRADESMYYYETRLKNLFLEAGLRQEYFQQVVLSSVVPAVNPAMTQLLQQFFDSPPLVLGPDIYLQMPIHVPKPYEIGSDLVANAYAAHVKYKQNAVIVDFGTALTFTVIKESGDIMGVSIAPGLKTAIHSLASNTAQLPEVPLRMPASAIGRDTTTAIQSGILVGYTGLVGHMIQSIRQELGGHCLALATGGLSSVLEPLQTEFTEINKLLTLEGIRAIGELGLRNQ